MKAGPERISSENTVILAGGFDNGEEVKMVRKSGVDCLKDLYSDKEEADTRLVLHAIHLVESYSRLIVKCDDTDVLVLLVYYASKGMFGSSQVFMHSGHGLKERFVPVCSIAQSLLFVSVYLHATPSRVAIVQAACTELERPLLSQD